MLPGIAVVAGRARVNANKHRLGGKKLGPIFIYIVAAVGMAVAHLWHALLFYVPPLSTLRIVQLVNYTRILTSNHCCDLIYKLMMF